MKIDHFLLGYKTFKVEEKDIARASSALLKRNLTAKISSSGSFDVPILKCKKYIRAMNGIEYSISDIQGLPSYFYNIRHRYGLIIGFALIFMISVFSSRFVWDIRILGNENVSDSLIEEELEKAGFSIGTAWSKLSLNKVELDFLEISETTGWININRRGNVAYVTVKEKNIYEQIEKNEVYSNIVATADCVIEDITVKSGIAQVKAGDTVKAGDLLISGIIPAELGGGFVRAEGEIYGRLFEEISVETPRNETIKIYGKERLSRLSIKIFNFFINIFKSYRKNDNSCVIIEDVEECVLFGKYRLPIEIRKVYGQDIFESQKEYNDKELVSVASTRLAKLRVMKLSDAELLSIKTHGEFTEIGYKMTSEVSYLKDIGEERYFSK